MSITRSRVVLSIVALALAACSSAPPDSTLDGEVNPSNSSKSNKTSSSSKTSGSTTGNTTTTNNPTDPADPAAPANPAAPAAPATPAPGTGQCASQTSADACFQCCDTAFPGGLDVDSQAFGQCVCEVPGTCAAACGTSYCAGQPATAACQQCLAGATQCEQQAEAACNANAACAGAMSCVDSSGCNTKQ